MCNAAKTASAVKEMLKTCFCQSQVLHIYAASWCADALLAHWLAQKTLQAGAPTRWLAGKPLQAGAPTRWLAGKALQPSAPPPCPHAGLQANPCKLVRRRLARALACAENPASWCAAELVGRWLASKALQAGAPTRWLAGKALQPSAPPPSQRTGLRRKPCKLVRPRARLTLACKQNPASWCAVTHPRATAHVHRVRAATAALAAYPRLSARPRLS